MTTELQEALSTVSHEAGEDFAHRDVTQVIDPATRRVRRHRARLTAIAALGSVAVLAGLLWGADTMAPNQSHPVSPASTPVVRSTAPENSWATLELAAQTGTRKYGQERKNAVAGMICRHGAPTDDPRVSVARANDPTISHATTFEDCTPVWFKGGPATGDMRSEVAVTHSPGVRFSFEFSVTNESDQPIEIDTDSVFMWIETAPQEAGGEPIASYARTLVGPSMWDGAGHTHALLDSGEDSTVIASGERFSALLVANEIAGEGALADALAAGGPATVSVWARIHEESPTGDASYLIQLGDSVKYYWEAS